MMNYELFKEMVKEKFMGYMPEKYRHMDMEITTSNKVNKVVDSFHLTSPFEGNRFISPSLNLTDMYEHYKKTENLDDVLKGAARTMAEAFEQMPDFGGLDKAEAKDNIIFQVVNTLQNEALLKNIPHRNFQDLSIIYRWMVSGDERGISSTIVSDSLASSIGMTEEQLYNHAVENTRRLLPPTVRSMKEIFMNMLMRDGMDESMADTMFDELPGNAQMYVISNEYGINGAGSMLYEEELHNLATDLDDDLYILPSSIHEVIALSAEGKDPEELAEMVNEINMGEVQLEERLSNQVYLYDKDLRRLSLATNTPNLRLDGMVAEPQLIYGTGKSR